MFHYFITHYKKKHDRWADYHRHEVFHCGKFTTQFVESVNAMMVTMGINGRSSIGDLVTELFKFEERQEYNTSFKSTHSNTSEIKKKNLTNGTLTLFASFIAFVDKNLTSHGKSLQYEELHQSVDFKVVNWIVDKNVYTSNIEHMNDRKLFTTITVDNGSKYHCSRCAHSIGNGIVCRHYLCMIREGLSNTEINSAFPIHALYVHSQWYMNGLCKEATDMKELIYPLVREHNISAKVTFIEFNPLIARVHKSNEVLRDSSGATIHKEEVCTTTLEYDTDTEKRLKHSYTVYKEEFMKKMSDLYDCIIVPRKADIYVLDTLTDKFVDAVKLHTSQIVTAAKTNNFNRGFTGLAPSKAAAKIMRKTMNNGLQIDGKRASSNGYRAAIEQKVQQVIEKQGIINSQGQGASEDDDEGEGESNRENVPSVVLLSEERSHISNGLCEPIELNGSQSRYTLRTVVKSKIYDDPTKANNGWYGQPKKKRRK